MLLSRMNLWGAMAIMSGLFKYTANTANTAKMKMRYLRQRAISYRKYRVFIYIKRGCLRYRHADQFEVGYGL